MKHVRRILMVTLALLLMVSSSAWAEERTEAEELCIIIDETIQYTSFFKQYTTETSFITIDNAYYGTLQYSRELTDEEKAAFIGHSGRLVSLDTGIQYPCDFWSSDNMFAVGVSEDVPAGKYEYTVIHVFNENVLVEGKCILEIGE